MDLGVFSISLAVKNLKESRAFYEKLGFTALGMDKTAPGYGEKWVILQNGEAKIGLFHGLFEKNALTFNPKDVRGIQKKLKAQGVKFTNEVDENTTGPGFAALLDPDGNPVLIDQHA